jgi:hypothetical protein
VPIQYFTKSQLKKANTEALKRGYNRTLHKRFVDSLSAYDKFPIINTFGDDQFVRVQIVLNAEGFTAWLDVPYELFNKLNSVDANIPTSH